MLVQKMKILHLCLANFYIDNYSYQENILPYYHKLQGNDVFILASTFSFDKNGHSCYLEASHEYEIEGIKIKRLAYKKGRIAKLLRIYKTDLKLELERILPDVIFIHGIQFSDIHKVATYARKHSSVRIFADNHADFNNSATNFLSRNILHGIIWKRCAHIIEPYTEKFYGVTPARVKFLERMYKLPKNKISFLPLGAEDDKVAMASTEISRKKYRDLLKVNDNDFVIITAGKIDNNKREIISLMKAIRMIERNNVKLFVFGTVIPELREDFSKQVDCEHVFYQGWLEPALTYYYFNAADLLVFPGKHSVYWEQAVGLGVPCIFKYIKGFSHVDIGGNCRFLENDSPESISGVLIEILDNPEQYLKMKTIAQSVGKDFFSYKRIARESIAISDPSS